VAAGGLRVVVVIVLLAAGAVRAPLVSFSLEAANEGLRRLLDGGTGPSIKTKRHSTLQRPTNKTRRRQTGAFFGTFLGGALMLRYGRRKAIAAQALFFSLGPVIMALANGPG